MSFADFKANLAGNRAYRTHAKANRLSDNGMADEAERLYRQAMEGYREAERLGFRDPKLLTGYAILLMREGEFARAKDMFEGLKDTPKMNREDRWHLRLDHAICAWRLGGLDQAIADMETCGQESKRGLYYSVMAALKTQKGRETGDLTEAEAFLKEALDYDEDDLSTFDNMGWLLLAKGEPDRAEEWFGKALKKNSRYSPAHAGLCRVALARGDKARAKEEAEQALSVHFPTTSPVTRAEVEALLKEATE